MSVCKMGLIPTFAKSRLLFLCTAFFYSYFLQTDRPAWKQLFVTAWKQCNIEGGFCTVLADIRQSVTVFEGSQGSPACPSDKTCIKMKMSMVQCWRG